jgi:hypothetical protein
VPSRRAFLTRLPKTDQPPRLLKLARQRQCSRLTHTWRGHMIITAGTASLGTLRAPYTAWPPDASISDGGEVGMKVARNISVNFKRGQPPTLE